jgi:hypothetical protein
MMDELSILREMDKYRVIIRTTLLDILINTDYTKSKICALSKISRGTLNKVFREDEKISYINLCKLARFIDTYSIEKLKNTTSD